MALDFGLPPGTRDFGFGEAAFLRSVENELLGLLGRWGYREIGTPTLEYLSTLDPEGAFSRSGAGQDCWKLFDQGGNILALRPEMTVPTARFASRALRGRGPWRLSYAAPIYRFRGDRRERRQVGVELLNLPGSAGDAEILALAVEVLRSLDLGVQIHLGHWGFLNGIFAAAHAPEALRERLRNALAERDLVSYGELTKAAGLSEVDRELLARIPFWHGGVEIFDQIPPPADDDSRRALVGLREVFALLESQGVREVRLDLGLVRDFAYYTGLVFEAYVPGLGRPILGGGRYDRLCARFGRDWSAVGFAIFLDGYLEMLESGGFRAVEPSETVLVPAPGREKEAHVLADGLRRRGKTITVWPWAGDLNGAGAYAAERGASTMDLGEAV